MASKDKRFFFAVGQKSFEAGESTNYFSTVIPIADTNGEIINDRLSEFPNRGRAWWMLRGEARITQAPPGCLVMSGIEDALNQSSSPDRDIYQLLQPRLPSPKDLLEILTPDAGITDPNQLLDDYRLRCDHEPSRHVLVKIGENLYGPLKIELGQPENNRRIEPEIQFNKPVAPHNVYCFPLAKVCGQSGYFSHEAIVQRGDSRPNDQFGHTIRYEAMTGALFDELRESAMEVDVVSLKDAVRQVSRDFLSRRERRDFLDNLDRFSKDSEASSTAIARVQDYINGEDINVDSLDKIYETLHSDERFKSKIDKAVDMEVEKRVDAQAARIDAHAKEKVAELNAEIVNLSEEKQSRLIEFDREIERRRKELYQEILTAHKNADREIEEKKITLHH